MANEAGGGANTAKETLQVVTDSAAEHIGKIATIVTTAVRDIARELGEWFNEVVESREKPAEQKDDSV
jgi:hypothetical protein